MSVINTLPENSNIQTRICDERWTMPFISYELGYQPIGVFPRIFSVQMISDINTTSDLVSLGYNPTDPFVMDGAVTNEEDVDPRVESIRRSFVEFKNKLNESFNQTKEEFIQNPQFFNFQNFIAENKFSISYAEKLLDVRNNVIYRGDKLKENSNKILMDQTLFGSTPSNMGEVRLMWQNIFFWPYDNEISDKEGLSYLDAFFSSRNIKRKYATSGTYSDPYTVRSSDGIEYYNNNYSVRPMSVSARRHIKLPANNESSVPNIGWEEGIILASISSETPLDRSPFVNLTPNKIFVRNIKSPEINPSTYKRVGISHKTVLSRNRLIRTPELGYGKGGSTEVQGRTPLVSSISKPSTIVIRAEIKNSVPVSNNNFNIFVIGGSRAQPAII